jgi:non-homologous end joining protein Ku
MLMEDEKTRLLGEAQRCRRLAAAFAVIRETIREMDKVAIGRVVLTNREHIIALEPMDKELVGTLLRYPLRGAASRSTRSRTRR